MSSLQLGSKSLFGLAFTLLAVAGAYALVLATAVLVAALPAVPILLVGLYLFGTAERMRQRSEEKDAEIARLMSDVTSTHSPLDISVDSDSAKGEEILKRLALREAERRRLRTSYTRTHRSGGGGDASAN